jgi:hypothetical protein
LNFNCKQRTTELCYYLRIQAYLQSKYPHTWKDGNIILLACRRLYWAEILGRIRFLSRCFELVRILGEFVRMNSLTKHGKKKQHDWGKYNEVYVDVL